MQNMDGMTVALVTYGIAAAISMLTAALIAVMVKVIEFSNNRKAGKK
ncbi:MAG TPA: hypothetical protein PKO22_07355 [Treponemataceae bacterium]|nr:hypothetical protein [Treponemataceae bacterium]